jgi:DNA-binding LacI/PurR family transcriptional regulator
MEPTSDNEGRPGRRRRAPAHPKATIDVVARQAGVSTATVSRVLSGSTAVSAELVDRVQKAVRALSYQPNGAARGLASGSLRHLGVVVPDLGNAYFFDIVKHMHRAALAEGYRIMIADSNGDVDAEIATARDLLGQVDGLVMMSPRMSTDRLKELGRQPTPVVLVNRVELGVDVPMVAADNVTAVMDLCAHLADLGHRRVVYLAGSDLAWQNRERWKAVQTASKLLNVHAVSVPGDGTIESGYAAVDAALRHQPTALICFNDLSALGAISALRDRGMTVPQDISVSGFDDIEIVRHVEPRLTTVVSPKDSLGAQTWAAMHALLAGEPVGPTILVPAELLIRESTGPSPSSSATR